MQVQYTTSAAVVDDSGVYKKRLNQYGFRTAIGISPKHYQ